MDICRFASLLTPVLSYVQWAAAHNACLSDLACHMSVIHMLQSTLLQGRPGGTTVLKFIMYACAGNQQGRHLQEWGWPSCRNTNPENVCTEWAPWLGRWGNSTGNASAGADPAAAPGRQSSFLYKCWAFVRDHNDRMFHMLLWFIGSFHVGKVWSDIWMYYWMRFWGYRPAWPSMHLDLLGL